MDVFVLMVGREVDPLFFLRLPPLRSFLLFQFLFLYYFIKWFPEGKAVAFPPPLQVFGFFTRPFHNPFFFGLGPILSFLVIFPQFCLFPFF